jgi:5-methylcytosine-specific restriction endonuclease McrA
MKHCARCDRWLPVDDFALAQGNRSGPHKRQAYCHWCGAEKSYEWKTLNREAKKRHARKSYWKNREKNIARCRVENMTEEQRLTKNARQRVYRKAHPELILMLNRTRRLTEAAAGGQIDRRTVERLLALQQNRCAVCGIELTNVAFHVDHRTPLSRGGTNEFSNLQILCKSCNLRKSGRDPIEFMNSEGYLI